MKAFLRRILAKLVMEGPESWDTPPQVERMWEWDRLNVG